MALISDIIACIEKTAPLRYQDEWDNSGLQVGFPEEEVKGILVCLDVTEEIVDEARRKGCNLILSHHPLIFKALKQVSDVTYQQRCVVKALASGIAIYSAHTSLDNARGGVNYMIAAQIGLQNLEWLSPGPDEEYGSGVIGNLPEPEEAGSFLRRLKAVFGVKSLRHSDADGCKIGKVAICGGAGAFLMRDAVKAGADCFISGEFHYHDYFETDGMILAELGHYQSEKYTRELICDLVAEEFPGVRIVLTEIDTDPIRYDF